MCLSLYDYQPKAGRYRKGLTYLKNGATTNQKHTTVKKKDQREYKGKRKGNHQTTKRNRERQRNKKETE